MDTRKKIIISALLGLFSILGIYSYIKHTENKLFELSSMVPVVTAADDIIQHTVIDETMIKISKLPKKYIQPGAILASEVGGILGQVTSAPILKGEQILGTKLLQFGKEAGLAMKIPAGMRAVSLLADEVTGVAGLIKPDDFVDILATFDFGNEAMSKQYTYTLFQNISVLAIDTDLGEGYSALTKKREDVLDKLRNVGSKKSFTVTVAVTPAQAQDIILAQEMGVVYLALRGIGEPEQELNLTPATPSEITGIKSLMKQQRKPRYLEYRGGNR